MEDCEIGNEDIATRDNMKETSYKYFAFISYKSEDLSEAWKLKKKLDSYKLPAILCKQYAKERKPTKEAFLDKTNIQPGSLNDELRKNLDSAHYLIVVCSPRSAKSEYVQAEIEWFSRNGREEQIFLFIIDSDPKNIGASVNPAILDAQKKWASRDGGEKQILGVNIKEKYVDRMFFLYRMPIIGAWLQRERAYMQLISKLLGLDFAQLWSYQRIRIIEQVIAWIIGVILFMGAVAYTWYSNRPIDVTVTLNETTTLNTSLPPLKNANVTIELENGKTETEIIPSLYDSALFRELAHKHFNKEVRIKVECTDYLPVDTILNLTQNIELNMYRDPNVYGKIRFRIWDTKGEPLINKFVKIAGLTAASDKEGMINIDVPIGQQQMNYPVYIDDYVDTLYMPCGKDVVIIVEP